MYIIGITGGTGAGKTLALNVLSDLGALTLDCDEIYHRLLLNSSDMKEEITANFADVLTDGNIDRKKLSKIVWKEPASLLKLNKITHKYVSSEIKRLIDEFKLQGGTITAIDAIALIESGLSKNCDIIVGITASEKCRKSRIMKRDALGEEQAQARINAQQQESYYKKNCDYIIENNFVTPTEFAFKCKEYFTELFSKQKPEKLK